MNRRELLTAGAALGVASALPLHATAAPSLVTWGPGAVESPHAALVLNQISEWIDAGEVFVSTNMRLIDHYLVLGDARFLIETAPSVWNFRSGYIPEPGLKVTILVKGERVEGSQVESTFGSYIIKPEDQGYRVRYPHVEWSRMDALKERGVEFRDCCRWLEDFKADQEALKGVVSGRVAHTIPNA